MNKAFVILIFCFRTLSAISQHYPVIHSSKLVATENCSALIKQIEEKYEITITYSSAQFDDAIKCEVDQGSLPLDDYLKKIFAEYTVVLKNIAPSRYVLQLRYNLIEISGSVISNEGEIIPGALIIDLSTYHKTISDENGFYYLKCKPGQIQIEIQMLPYKSYTYTGTAQSSQIIDHTLVYDGVLTTLIVKEKALSDPLSDIMTGTAIAKQNTLGEASPLQLLKTSPGVLPGSENQSNLSIRGGSPDQNLYLVDGMPIYEPNHSGSFSSIFNDESVNSIEFMKNGTPSRYGGRIGSVINIKLKDGNQDHTTNNINVGIQGISFFSEGPLVKNKLTYAISLKQSYLNTTLSPFKKYISVYDDVNINYRDLQAKISYKLTPHSKLSLTSYMGDDHLILFKSETGINPLKQNSDQNQFRISNRLLSLNYQNIISNKCKLSANLGHLNYSVVSRAIYTYYNSAVDTSRNLLDVINLTKIRDKQMNVSCDYFIHEALKVKAGIGLIHHDINPAVKQSLLTIEENFINKIKDGDSTTLANDFNLFFEVNYRWKNFIFIPGLHHSIFHVNEKNKRSLQPRFQLNYNYKQILTIHAAYTIAAQNIHLLTNSGLGLPSELWVPSTTRVPTEWVRHLSTGLRLDLGDSLSLGISYYRKKFIDQIDYIEPVDQFLNIINSSIASPVLNSQRDWERKIEIGNGRAFGYEISLRHQVGLVNYWVSYHYGRAYKKFDKINKGKEYVSKYDRPHQVSTGLCLKIRNNLSFSTQWVYASGQPFTLADEVFVAPLDPGKINVTFIQPSSKNNYRMPAFHQLSVNGTKTMTIKGLDAQLTFGLYNAYNRLNAFYLYSVLKNDGISFKKVSIFPILPQINFRVSW